MRRVLTLVLCSVTGAAMAEPTGAPWDHVGRPGGPDCTECHFDSPARRQSPDLMLGGLPAFIAPGAGYDLTLSLRNGDAVFAGFLIAGDSGGAPSGRFEGAAAMEADGAALRSTRPRGFAGDTAVVTWRFRWIAPAGLAASQTFFVAVNAGNDDASPFGDTVYLSRFIVPRK